MSTANHVFSAFSFISFFLVSISSPRHFRARNVATCLYILWVSLSNLTFFINSIIWNGNVNNNFPIWCDITGHQGLATNVAIPATCLCIQRHVYHILSVKTSTKKRPKLILDLLIGLFIPLLNPVLAYIVQAHRYTIMEDFGCRLRFDSTTLAVVLIPTWKVSLSLISGVYGCFNIYHIWIKRQAIRSLLASSVGALDDDHYIRLFMLSGIDILITIPINLYGFMTWFPVVPWPGWTAMHSNWSQIPLVTSAEWKVTIASTMIYETSRWISVIYALIFFVFFGISEESRKPYISVLRYVARKTGCLPRERRPESATPHPIRPSYPNSLHATCDKTDSLRSPHMIGSITAPSIMASDSDSKYEMETRFSQSAVDLKEKTPVSPPFFISHIPSPVVSESDPELGSGVLQPAPPVLEEENFVEDFSV